MPKFKRISGLKESEVVIGQDYVETLDFAPFPKVEIGNPAALDFRIAPQKRRLTLKGLSHPQVLFLLGF